MDRRSVIAGIVASLATPSIVHAENLMKLYIPSKELIGISHINWQDETTEYQTYLDVFGNIITERKLIPIPSTYKEYFDYGYFFRTIRTNRLNLNEKHEWWKDSNYNWKHTMEDIKAGLDIPNYKWGRNESLANFRKYHRVGELIDIA